MEFHYHLHYEVHIHPNDEGNADIQEKLSLFGRQLLYDVLEKQIQQMESI